MPLRSSHRAIAVAANKELIDAAEAKGYGLATNLEDLRGTEYYSDASSTKEILFARRTASSSTFEGYNFPVGYSSGQGGNCPTQDLVDAFECTAQWREMAKRPCRLQ